MNDGEYPTLFSEPVVYKQPKTKSLFYFISSIICGTLITAYGLYLLISELQDISNYYTYTRTAMPAPAVYSTFLDFDAYNEKKSNQHLLENFGYEVSVSVQQLWGKSTQSSSIRGLIDPSNSCLVGTQANTVTVKKRLLVEKEYEGRQLAATCGDGKREGGELCDDGNNVNGDGCTATCTVQIGYTCKGGSPTSKDICTTVPVCGNGKREGGEQCDDGNTLSGDGCTAGCRVANGWSCSGGSPSSPDSCKAQSVPGSGPGAAPGPSDSTSICGNGNREPPELCDDGGKVKGDGCNDVCRVEPGWVCVGGSPTSKDTCKINDANQQSGGGSGSAAYKPPPGAPKDVTVKTGCTPSWLLNKLPQFGVTIQLQKLDQGDLVPLQDNAYVVQTLNHDNKCAGPFRKVFKDYPPSEEGMTEKQKSVLKKLNEWVSSDKSVPDVVVDGISQKFPTPMRISIVTNYTSGLTVLQAHDDDDAVYSYPFKWPLGDTGNIDDSGYIRGVTAMLCGVASVSQKLGPTMDGISVQTDKGEDDLFITITNLDSTRWCAAPSLGADGLPIFNKGEETQNSGCNALAAPINMALHGHEQVWQSSKLLISLDGNGLPLMGGYVLRYVGGGSIKPDSTSLQVTGPGGDDSSNRGFNKQVMLLTIDEVIFTQVSHRSQWKLAIVILGLVGGGVAAIFAMLGTVVKGCGKAITLIFKLEPVEEDKVPMAAGNLEMAVITPNPLITKIE